jgi:glycosyltransferase involved in cell wall biosynthesis
LRVGIDGKALSLKVGGIGRYAINLVGSLAKILDNEPGVEIVLFPGPRGGSEFSVNHHVSVSNRLARIDSSVIRSLLGFPFILEKEKIDVFHGLHHAGLPLFNKRGKFVITIHDMIYSIHPGCFTWKHRQVINFMLPKTVARADRVIADSYATKKDLCQFLKIDDEKIKVIHLGLEGRFKTVAFSKIEEIKKKYRIRDDYILFVGVIEPRKNIVSILEALSILKQTGKLRGKKLVVAGRKGWLFKEIFERVQALNLEDDVAFTGFVEEEDLPALYGGALFFVYPSRYEGFGLPVLEAMGCGTPVITSKVSSLPEVAGDAAILVDPMDVEELAWRMEMLCENRDLREELSKKGVERARLFSWEKTARETLEVYKELA